ncbi:MAG: virulence factor SrfC family protein [Pseudomonadota bacterium]
MTEDLTQTCQRTQTAATDALAWFADAANAEKVGQERTQLEREFRRYATQAGRLSHAVDRPMCVGVFGPSQAGKSYLVSVLAQKGDAPLMARFGGEPDRDFISQINPEGERESTGIVTRFTITPTQHPEGFPVCLRLLGEMDVVKILGNSYCLDSAPKSLHPIPPEDLSELLDRLRARATATVGEVKDEDIWDLQDYFQKHFGHLPIMPALAAYWEAATELAPKLDIASRAELFAPLWGRYPEMTELYLKLVTALSRLGFAAEAFSPMDALIPRSASIIDVEMLAGLNDPNAGGLSLRPLNGAVVELPRPVVTALTAELRIVMTDRPHDFFDHTDLLDFPGARSRQPIDFEEFLQEENALKELMVRGKVAYLFDRYVAEQELTSMALCIRDSTQEVTTLPDMIADWIDATHGKTAADRAGRPVLLFFVLTMFDKHFMEKAGEDASELGVRFTSRLHASLTGFFGKAHGWVKDWAGGQPFNNVFLMRNPTIKAEFMIEYDGAREVQIIPDKAPRIDALEEAFRATPEVQAHINQPKTAWDAMLKLNDGGVSYLAESLAPVCEPDMKRRQVAARLSDLRARMAARIAPLHISDDVETRRAERREIAERVLGALEGSADHGRFGALVREMQIDYGLLQDHLYRVQRRPGQSVEAAAIATPPPARRSGGSRFGKVIAAPAETPDAPAAAPSQPKSKFDLFAEEMVTAWIAAIGQRAESDLVARSLQMPIDDLKEVVTELAGGAKRLKLEALIAAQLNVFNFPEVSDRNLARLAMVGAQVINTFVAALGFAERPEAERPKVLLEEGERPAFPDRNPAWTSDAIGAEQHHPAEHYVLDWGFSFLTLVDENATSSDGQTIDVEQNGRIGRILAEVTDAQS